MPRHGSRRSRARSSLEHLLALLLVTMPLDRLGAFEVVGDEIPVPLVAEPGDPTRGRAIVVDRRKGLCLLCHSGPFPEERFQGDLAPTLAGAGSRHTAGRLRLQLVDSRRLDPESIMPAYHRTTGLNRVAPAFEDKPLLTAAEIEDVVAFLLTLREEPTR